MNSMAYLIGLGKDRISNFDTPYSVYKIDCKGRYTNPDARCLKLKARSIVEKDEWKGEKSKRRRRGEYH